MKRILVLHDMAKGSRRTNRDHVYNYAKYHPGHLYVFHSIKGPITEALKAFPFDGIIMNYCFLSNRASAYELQKDRWSYLADHPATKIAICQDDYTDHLSLDEWIRDMRCDVIFSPIQKNLEVLYPTNWGKATFREGLTGYTDHAQIEELESYSRPFHERTIDVGTRVRYLPPVFGRYGQQKGKAAEDFARKAAEAGFNVDISTRTEDVIFGSRWLQFLGNCKFTLGSKGGASMADPRGEIRVKVAEFMAKNPGASFEMVEQECFKGVDGHYVFAGVSPRLFESAALRTCQILTRDNYIGGMEPYVDYIPLDEDFSNIDEVFGLMRNEDACLSMIDSCYEKLIASKAFDYSAFVNEVLDFIPEATDMGQRNESRLLEDHFSTINAFRRTRERFGGTLETALKTVLTLLKPEHAIPLETTGWPRPYALSPGFAPIAAGIPAVRRSTYSMLPEIMAYAEGDPEAMKDLATIFDQLAHGEIAPERHVTDTGALGWWDMCEYIFELGKAEIKTPGKANSVTKKAALGPKPDKTGTKAPKRPTSKARKAKT